MTDGNLMRYLQTTYDLVFENENVIEKSQPLFIITSFIFINWIWKTWKRITEHKKITEKNTFHKSGSLRCCCSLKDAVVVIRGDVANIVISENNDPNVENPLQYLE